MTAAQSGHDRPVSAGIGVVLRAARAGLGLSLAEVSARTKIRPEHLAALEDERLGSLPPYPFARGFLRTYAIELGLDPEPLLQRLAEAMLQEEPAPIEEARRLETAIRPARPMSPAQRAVRSATIVGLVAGTVLLVYFAKQLHEFSQPVPAPTPQGAVPSPQVPVPQASVPQASAPAPVGVMTQVTGSGITIDVEATGRSWILVVADEVAVYEGFVTAGERRRWQAKGSMTVRVGNAGAVILTVNGRSVGALGAPGEVVSRTFRGDDVR